MVFGSNDNKSDFLTGLTTLYKVKELVNTCMKGLPHVLGTVALRLRHEILFYSTSGLKNDTIVKGYTVQDNRCRG